MPDLSGDELYNFKCQELPLEPGLEFVDPVVDGVDWTQDQYPAHLFLQPATREQCVHEHDHLQGVRGHGVNGWGLRGHGVRGHGARGNGAKNIMVGARTRSPAWGQRAGGQKHNGACTNTITCMGSKSTGSEGTWSKT